MNHIKRLIEKYPKQDPTTNYILDQDHTFESWTNVFSLFKQEFSNFNKPLLNHLLEKLAIQVEDPDSPGEFKFNKYIPESLQKSLDLYLFGKIYVEENTLEGSNSDIFITKLNNVLNNIQNSINENTIMNTNSNEYDNINDINNINDNNYDNDNFEMNELKRGIQETNSTKPKNNCDKRSIFVQYETPYYTCNGTIVSFNQYEKYINDVNSTMECYTNTTIHYACICPLEKTGDYCKNVRKFDCKSTMLTPIPQCQKPPIHYGGISLDGDFPCHVMDKSSEAVPFSFLLNCSFAEDPDWKTINSNLTNNSTVTIVSNGQKTTVGSIRNKFTYFFKSSQDENPQFALYQPISQNFTLKFYNFNRLGDQRGRFNVPLKEGELYVGKKVIQVTTFIPSSLPNDFFAGERLYGEIGFILGEVSGLNSMNNIRLFLDFKDRQPPEYTDYTNLIIGLVVPFGSIILLTILGIIIGYCYYKKIKDRNFLKAD
ncbi:predicted protein [Naegleria gruberi]|uniref:Predicted protein n=1 Tax=Naegleria gruberi TaxID=5762 RepID=D2VN50_NAEGR|nr:uncharacterized protein NAEGRDRAFT_70371 [Naegleria gruberi]EFC41681.1 predicted protein [Naegleria gruberi]|eukprot:XP_002674425.1 predicted protein [Naegleria gruberi strain NEG-M]